MARPLHWLLCALPLWLAACAMPSKGPWDHEVAAPAELVAWLCADALRHDLVGADPLPMHAMAPCDRGQDGRFVVRYEGRPDGAWAPRASARIFLDPGAAARGGALRHEPARGLHGWRRPDRGITVRIEPTPTGAAVAWSSHGPTPPGVLEHLHRACAFAEELAADATNEEPTSCCSAHAPLAAMAHERAAMRRLSQGDLLGARLSLVRAAACWPDHAPLAARIAALDVELGQDRLAAGRAMRTSRLLRDPGGTQQLWAMAEDKARELLAGNGDLHRRTAKERMAQGRLGAAHALLHAARTLDPDRVQDLLLRRRLARLEQDPQAALGYSLLLRESGRGDLAEPLLAQDLRDSGHARLGDRAAFRALAALVPTRLFEQGAAQLARLRGDLGRTVGPWLAAPPR